MRGSRHVLILALAAGGCANPQLFLTPERLDRGLVMVLTGIEGRSPINNAICRGLNDGGVNWAIELVDWTWGVPGAYLVNLRSEVRNRQKAEDLAQRIVRYQMAHPGRPVVLVGQSGGSAIGAWIAESMPPGRQVDGLVFLAPTLSPEYLLDLALLNSRRGIVSFHSSRDWFLLGAGTLIYGTMDGVHSSSAGRVGFRVPPAASMPRLYEKLFQIPWHEAMQQAGHSGGHLTTAARPFVARYVAPLVTAGEWDESLIKYLLSGPLAVPLTRPRGGR